MEIQKITDASFGKYGRVLEGYSIDRILKEMEHTPLPIAPSSTPAARG